MSKKMPMAQGALLLTGVNLLLRFVSTSFQVYLSSAIGPKGIGLLQLVLSVSGLAMTAGIAGVRTTAMYLTAEDLGRGRRGSIPWVLTGCFGYVLVTGGGVSLALWIFAPSIAQHWIGSVSALPALRTFASFLPITCLCGVMTGYFTAAGRIATLTIIEIAEQICCMTVTVLALLLLPEGDIAGSCRAVVLGSAMGNLLTFLCLMALYWKERRIRAAHAPVAKRLLTAAVPLALADDLKAGISSLENLMVPKRLALYPSAGDPLASFGIVSGMVFPVVMFPAAILFSLAELLIPELAGCAARGSSTRINYLARRSLRFTALYGLACGGILCLLSGPLCTWLYPGVEVAPVLEPFALLVPMLYCDLIVDAMTKGLGQQRICVRYNILSNSLDVILLFLLLPQYGISGYFASFLITHVLNFALSLRRLLKICKPELPIHFLCFSLAAWFLALFGASRFTGPLRRLGAFLGLFFLLSYFFGVWQREDLRWLRTALYTTPSSQAPPRP